jgi:hypothetical protein
VSTPSLPNTAGPSSAGREVPPDNEGRSVGDLVGEIADDLSRLVRKEIDLAKTEAKQEVTKLGKGAGMLTGAGSPLTCCCCSCRSRSCWFSVGPWTWISRR